MPGFNREHIVFTGSEEVVILVFSATTTTHGIQEQHAPTEIIEHRIVYLALEATDDVRHRRPQRTKHEPQVVTFLAPTSPPRTMRPVPLRIAPSAHAQTRTFHECHLVRERRTPEGKAQEYGPASPSIQ